MEYQTATMETLLMSDSLLTPSSRPSPPSLVYPHPHPASLSPRAIAQSTVTELSTLDWEGHIEYREVGYHPEYRELSTYSHHHSPPPPGSPDMAR